MRVFVFGPDPFRARTGGIATHVGYLLRTAEQNGVRAIGLYSDLPGLRDHFVTRTAGTFASALSVLGRARPGDVLHLNATLSPQGAFRVAPLVVAAKSKRIAVLLQLHGGRLATVERSRAALRLWSAIFRSVDVVGLFPGPQTQEFEDRRSDVRVVQLYNMVPEASRAVAASSAAPRYLFLGRLTEEKGVLDAIGAFASVSQHLPDATLEVAGDGPLRAQVERLSRASLGRIKCLGHLAGDALAATLDSSNVLILPSRQEGFPLSFLECGVRGYACLVTRQSAIPALFTEGSEFLSLDGTFAQLSECMLTVGRANEQRRRMGLALREHIIRRFTIATAGARYATIYAALSAGRVADLKGN